MIEEHSDPERVEIVMRMVKEGEQVAGKENGEVNGGVNGEVNGGVNALTFSSGLKRMNPKKKIIRASMVPQSLNSFCRDMLAELNEKYEVVAVSTPGPALIELAEREGVRTVAVPMECKYLCL